MSLFVTVLCLSCRKGRDTLPAVASAEVRADLAVLCGRPDASAPSISGLLKGDRLNILYLPVRKDQEWVQAQLVRNGTVTPPGFIKASDLGNWSSERPDGALRLLLLFARPDPDAPLNVQQAYWKQLEEWDQRFGGAGEGSRLSVELAREYLFWAEAVTSKPEASGERTHLLACARKALDRAAQAQSLVLEARVVDSRYREVESLKPAVVTPAPAPNLPAVFNEVHALWGRGEYAAALQRVNTILAQVPDNREAITWKNRLHAAIEAERALSR